MRGGGQTEFEPYSVTRAVEPLVTKLTKRTTNVESFFIGNAFTMAANHVGALLRHSEKPENRAGILRRFSDYSESQTRGSSAVRLRLGGRNDDGSCERASQYLPQLGEARRGSESNYFPNRISNLVELGKKFCLPQLEKARVLPRPQGEGRGERANKAAFTLAEVLITLGIIGIVAAMTMPTLIQNHKKRVVETRLAKFYSVMNQAVMRSEVDNGPKELWQKLVEVGNDQYGSLVPEEFFNKYMKPYLKLTRVEVDQGFVLVYFPDGSMMMFSANAIIFYPEAKDYGKVIQDEETGEAKYDYKGSGTKAFDFAFWPSASSQYATYHKNKGVEPYKWGWDGTRETLLNNGDIGCKKGVTHEPAYCAALIQLNGWKIPDDYPFNF